VKGIGNEQEAALRETRTRVTDVRVTRLSTIDPTDREAT